MSATLARLACRRASLLPVPPSPFAVTRRVPVAIRSVTNTPSSTRAPSGTPITPSATSPAPEALAGVAGNPGAQIPREPPSPAEVGIGKAAAAATGAGAGNSPPPSGKPPRRRRGFFRGLFRLAAGTTLVGFGVFGYCVYEGNHPPDQLPVDPSKKTVVVLGSGWGATSLLKNLDTEDYNVVVVSPRNYFLFTPLLPSVTVGTLDSRSIIQPTRFLARFKRRYVQVYEAEAEDIDTKNKTVTFEDKSEVVSSNAKLTIPYDYLVFAVGAETQTFGIPGVKEHACYLKELWDAEKVRKTLMDCVETAALKDQSEEDVNRLLHMVVVGGGPTGIEYAGELHDFLVDDLQKWYPEIANKLKITLIEALPNVLPSFSKQLIQYTESTFKENEIDILTKHMVKGVHKDHLVVQDDKKNMVEIPYGLLVWATGNTQRPITRQLMATLSEKQNVRRGLLVDDYLRLLGAEDSIFALGDATATQFAPTAQAASQQGAYLARVFGQMAKKEKLERALEEARVAPWAEGETEEARAKRLESLVKQLNKASKVRPFHYSHQGSLAYIGSEKAIADLPFFHGNVATGGVATYLFWRSAYISTLYSLRNRTLVIADWVKVKIFGRDVSRE